MSAKFAFYPPKPQFFDDDGNPLSLGTVEIYQGGTAILAAIYSENPGATLASNPVPLNARGEPATPIFLEYNKYYDIVVKDALGATVYSADGVIINTTTVADGVVSGAGSPEGAVSAAVGTLYRRTDGGAGTSLYVKESGGAGNTGWVAK
jgi:hypothetical protein